MPGVGLPGFPAARSFRMRILVFNAGSTSLKFGLFDQAALTPVAAGSLDWADGDRQQATLAVAGGGREALRQTVAVPDSRAAVELALGSLPKDQDVAAVGHRVVHGGHEFSASRRLDGPVKAAISRLSRLVPLHNPPALAVIEAVGELLPGAPQAAVFDTAFFAGLSPRASLYALPGEWVEKWGLKRIGFHGISHAYCALRAAEILGVRPHPLRQITCHLGGGCSAAALLGGQPVATTMGFSPLEGLMMGTRCGSVDPGLLIYLQRECGLSLEELDAGLNHRSGLLGLSGVSPDPARLATAAAAGNPRARLALDIFADRVRSAIGALATNLGGLDVLVFTDRIGENDPGLRASITAGLEFLGVQLDPDRNGRCAPDVDVSRPGSPVRILVLRTREEWMIARDTSLALGLGVRADASTAGL